MRRTRNLGIGAGVVAAAVILVAGVASATSAAPHQGAGRSAASVVRHDGGEHSAVMRATSLSAGRDRDGDQRDSRQADLGDQRDRDRGQADLGDQRDRDSGQAGLGDRDGGQDHGGDQRDHGESDR